MTEKKDQGHMCAELVLFYILNCVYIDFNSLNKTKKNKIKKK